MAPCLICYFIVTIFYIERNWLLVRNLTKILPLMSKMSMAFQHFNAIDGSIKMLRSGIIQPPSNPTPHQIKSITSYQEQNILSTLMLTETCGQIKKSCLPKIIILKKNCKYEILNHLLFCPNSVFLWTALGRCQS